MLHESKCVPVFVLTLVCVVLDLEFQLPGVGLHSVHVVLQVLLLLFMSVLELNELLLRDTETQTYTQGLVRLAVIHQKSAAIVALM